MQRIQPERTRYTLIVIFFLLNINNSLELIMDNCNHNVFSIWFILYLDENAITVMLCRISADAIRSCKAIPCGVNCVCFLF